MRTLCLLLTMLCSLSAFAQDNIIFTDGTETKALVKEIGPETISYVKADNTEGPLYTIERNKVFMIQLSNGTSELITSFDLLKTTVPDNNLTTETGRRRAFGGEYRSPGMAFLFSFLAPGGGQYYNRQYGKGAAMSALWLGGIITAATAPPYWGHEDYYYYDDFDPNYPQDAYYERRGYYEPSPQRTIGHAVWLSSWVWSMIDAPISAAKINRRNAKANATGLLDFNLKNGASVGIHPFRSHGLGGSVALNF